MGLGELINEERLIEKGFKYLPKDNYYAKMINVSINRKIGICKSYKITDIDNNTAKCDVEYRYFDLHTFKEISTMWEATRIGIQ